MTDIDQIKQKVDIVSLISEYVTLKKTGANFKGLCPFHNEKTPSFVVSQERQIWHCFGGCQDGGDIFKFLMRVENIEFSEALQTLAKRAGITLTSYQPSQQTRIREKIFEINRLASEFYNYILTTHPLGQTAREYFENRKIDSNSVKLFSLGYAPNSWDSLIKFMAKKKYTAFDLEIAGLVSKSGIGHYYDRFRGRVMFTLKDHHGNVVGFAGRIINEEVYPAQGGAKYVNTAETPVYIKGNVLYGLDVTKDDIKKEGFAVVVEGEVDAIRSYQAGVRNIVAIKGSALTAGHVSLLKRYTENILLSLDSDFAGDAAAHRGIETADNAGLNIKVVTFTQAKDPDELININPSLWREAIEKAVPFHDYIIDDAVSKNDPKSALGSKKIVSEVAKFLEPIENLVVKNHYLKNLATKLDIPQDVLENQLAKEFRKGLLSVSSSSSQKEDQKEAPRTREGLLEEYLLSLLLQSPRPSDYLLLILPRLSAEDLVNPTLSKIYGILSELPDKTGGIGQIAKEIPEELMPTVDRLYLQETNLPLEDDAVLLAEIQKIAWTVKELSLRNKLKTISTEIKNDPENPNLDEEFSKATLALQKHLEEQKLLSSAAS